MDTGPQHIFRVELLPARHGDCILVSYGPSNAPYMVLIDGGPASSYTNLATRLQAVPPAARQLELLAVTHIDSDHIGGVVKLLGDESNRPQYKELWFNGWDQLVQPLHPFRAEHADMDLDARSPLEGFYAGLLVRRDGAIWNASFGGRAICIDRGADPPEVQLAGGLKLTILSPDVAALKELRDHWDRARSRLKFDAEDPAALQDRLDADKRYGTRGSSAPVLSRSLISDLTGVAQELDDAVANGSSIAFIAEYEGRRCAFLGDAHMPVVEAALRRLLVRYGEPRVRLDALKVSHHGSKGNTTQALLELIDCNRYLISTDGSQFGHPDDEAIARIIRFASKPTEFYFNYQTAQIGRWGDPALQSSESYQAIFPASGAGITLDLI